MNRFFYSLFLLGLLGFTALPSHAQQNPTVKAIQQAYEAQRLDRGTKLLYQLYAGLQPDRLPPAFRPAVAERQPIKCATPYLIEYRRNYEQFSDQSRTAIKRLIAPEAAMAEERYTSPSGRFVVIYRTGGFDEVPAGDTNGNGIPDYVEWTAAAADSSWRHQVQHLGFVNPVTGSTDPYPIYIEDLGADGFYGYTTTGDFRGYPNSTYIVINSQLDQPAFTQNDAANPVRGAVRVTVAHELKHAIQYANSRWYAGGPHSPHDLDWSEMDATLMEEIVYDPVNDYYNYIYDSDSIFEDPDHPVPVAYGGVTWMIYFAQQYEPAFWVAVWRRIGRRYEAVRNNTASDFLSMPDAVALTLQEGYNTGYGRSFARSHLWHYASGPVNATANFGFDEAAQYPAPTLNTLLAGRDSITVRQLLPALTARYFEIAGVQSIPGSIRIEVNSADSFASLGLLAYFNDGSTASRTVQSGADGRMVIHTGWEWEAVRKVGMTLANPSPSLGTTYTLKVESDIPDRVILNQNYPNPFSGQTVIPLALPERMHVRIDIIDVAGRRVDTVIDEERPAGFNAITYEAPGLASGIYFIRVKAGGRLLIQKMAFIK